MGSALTTCLPIFAFMLIPVWIPIIGTALGALCDQLLPRTSSPAEQAVAAAKTRSAEARSRSHEPSTLEKHREHRFYERSNALSATHSHT